MSSEKLFAVYRDDSRFISGLLAESDADKLVDLINSDMRGVEEQFVYNQEEEWDGTVPVISLKDAKYEWFDIREMDYAFHHGGRSQRS